MNSTNTVPAVLDGLDISLAARLGLEKGDWRVVCQGLRRKRGLTSILVLQRYFESSQNHISVGCGKIVREKFRSFGQGFVGGAGWEYPIDGWL